MKRILGMLALAGGLALSSGGAAKAQLIVDDWTLDLTAVGIGLETVISDIDVIGFTAAKERAQLNDTNGNMAPDVGETYRVVGLGIFSTFANDDSGPISVPEINNTTAGGIGGKSGFQLTFVFDVTVRITSFGPGAGQVNFRNQSGSLDLYVDNLDPTDAIGPGTLANPGSGLFYDDGTNVASFTLRNTGEGGDVDIIGADQAGRIDATFVLDPPGTTPGGIILDGPGGNDIGVPDSLLGLVDENLDTTIAGGQLDVPIATSAMSFLNTAFGGFPFDPDGAGPLTGTGIDFMVFSDGTTRLALPEPATLGVLGTGLLGLGLALRRRRKLATA